MLRAKGRTGRYCSVMAWSDRVARAEISTTIRVFLTDGSVHVHTRNETGWHIELQAGDARSGIDLGGFVAHTPVAAPKRRAQVATPVLELSARPRIIRLGQHHYRRSEQSWNEAGKPTAELALAWTGRALRLSIEVDRSELTFAPAIASNRYDNEHPDVNGDGVQLYVSSILGLSGWMLVPERESTHVRARQIEGWPAEASISATWSPSATGYRIDVDVSGCRPQGLDVLINEMPSGRERRRGQLMLSGMSGGFVYLRGDRHDVDRLIPLRLVDG
jgi:hypothetical protein